MKTLHHPFATISLLTTLGLLGPAVSGFSTPVAPAKTRPVLVITYPLAKGFVTNTPTITVAGKTKDTVAVTNVNYRVNGGAWSLASTTNGYTNWTASVNLALGTNVVQAYAADANGNFSLTNKVLFTYVIYVPVTVQIVGQGTVKPNYSGKNLQLGKTYSMTAMPARGFGFAGWTGSQQAATPRLTFQVASNEVFTAHFVDNQRPILAILSPKPSQKEDAADLVVSGKAGDNVGVTAVYVQLNGTGWYPAATGNGYTNWTANVTLTAGANTIQAYAEDAAGNRSLTNSANLYLHLSHPG